MRERARKQRRQTIVAFEYDLAPARLQVRQTRRKHDFVAQSLFCIYQHSFTRRRFASPFRKWEPAFGNPRGGETSLVLSPPGGVIFAHQLRVAPIDNGIAEFRLLLKHL